VTPSSGESGTEPARGSVAGLLVWGIALGAIGAAIFASAQRSWLVSTVYFWDTSAAELWMLLGGLLAALGVVLVLTGAYRGAKMLEDLHARETESH